MFFCLRLMVVASTVCFINDACCMLLPPFSTYLFLCCCLFFLVSVSIVAVCLLSFAFMASCLYTQIRSSASSPVLPFCMHAGVKPRD